MRNTCYWAPDRLIRCPQLIKDVRCLHGDQLCHFSGPGESPRLLGLFLHQWRTLLWRSCLICHNCFNQRRWPPLSWRSSSSYRGPPFSHPGPAFGTSRTLKVASYSCLLFCSTAVSTHSATPLLYLYHFPQRLTQPGKKALPFGYMLPDYLFLHA